MFKNTFIAAIATKFAFASVKTALKYFLILALAKKLFSLKGARVFSKFMGIFK
jgi:hypothetical protein